MQELELYVRTIFCDPDHILFGPSREPDENIPKLPSDEDLALENWDPRLNLPSVTEPVDRRFPISYSNVGNGIILSMFGLLELTNDMSESCIGTSPYDLFEFDILVNGDLHT